MPSDQASSDVTALVLTVGEAYTERAIASVERQVPRVAETVIVSGVHPFHRALNEGATRVRTPFFVQVDADMILDENCVAELRGCMTDGVGIVVGHLRDPLLERTVGIKLFRKSCFDAVQMPDSVSPDTDLAAALETLGWHSVFALKYDGATPHCWHAFGEHRPEYTPLYTFSKYLLEGARLRHRARAARRSGAMESARRIGRAARHLFRRLHASQHAAARYALIAAAHGIFAGPTRDSLRPYEPTAEFRFLEQLLSDARVGGGHKSRSLGDIVGAGFAQAFTHGFGLGIEIRSEQGTATLLACIDALAGREDVAAWVALVGLCHGLFAADDRERAATESFRQLTDLLPD